MSKRKRYSQSRLQELIDDLKKYGLTFAVYYRASIKTLVLFTAVKSYRFPVDDGIKEISVYPNNELMFKIK